MQEENKTFTQEEIDAARKLLKTSVASVMDKVNPGPQAVQGELGPQGAKGPKEEKMNLAKFKETLEEDWQKEVTRAEAAGEEPFLFQPVLNSGGFKHGFRTKAYKRPFNSCTSKRAWVLQNAAVSIARNMDGLEETVDFSKLVIKKIEGLVRETGCAPQVIQAFIMREINKRSKFLAEQLQSKVQDKDAMDNMVKALSVLPKERLEELGITPDDFKAAEVELSKTQPVSV